MKGNKMTNQYTCDLCKVPENPIEYHITRDRDQELVFCKNCMRLLIATVWESFMKEEFGKMLSMMAYTQPSIRDQFKMGGMGGL